MALNDHVLIVGAGLAAARLVQRLRRRGHTGPITVVGQEQHLPYDRPPLSKAGLLEDLPPTVLLTDDDVTELDVRLARGRRAIGLDAAEHRVTLDDGTAVDYDHLVIATGAAARTLPALADTGDALTLRTWDDSQALRARLLDTPQVTIVGGGVLGLEVAAAARSLGVEVDVVEGAAQPLARVVGLEVGAHMARRHVAHGVRLHLGQVVDTVKVEDGRLRSVTLSSGTELSTGLVVVTIGSIAATAWLEGSGVTLDDGVVVDEFGRSSAPDVYAVGDVARLPHAYHARGLRLEHWTSAGETAGLVAATLLADAGEEQAYREVPYFWTDQYGVTLQGLGHPSPEDHFVVVDGDIQGETFLGAYVRDGVLRAVAGIGAPAALNRCRAAVLAGLTFAEFTAAEPWVRKPVAR
jgi:3-phenylpropionate/trans-cinnamate dioxygenase ferredoxin reductase subunit